VLLFSSLRNFSSSLKFLATKNLTVFQGFTLEFVFDENQYFTNNVLTKYYKLQSQPDENDPFSFEGPEIVSCTGYVC